MKYYQYEASNLEEQLIEAKYLLDDTGKLIYVAMRRNVADPILKAHLEIIADKCPPEILENHRFLRSHESKVAEEELGFLTKERLVDLHRDLKFRLSEYARVQW